MISGKTKAPKVNMFKQRWPFHDVIHQPYYSFDLSHKIPSLRRNYNNTKHSKRKIKFCGDNKIKTQTNLMEFRGEFRSNDNERVRFQTAPVSVTQFPISHKLPIYLTHRRIYWFLILIMLRSRLIYFTILKVDIIFFLCSFLSFFFSLSISIYRSRSIGYRDRWSCQLFRSVLFMNPFQMSPADSPSSHLNL